MEDQDEGKFTYRQVRINCPLQGSVATVTTLIHFMDLLAVAIHHGCRHA